jgi:hypothetical protein
MIPPPKIRKSVELTDQHFDSNYSQRANCNCQARENVTRATLRILSLPKKYAPNRSRNRFPVQVGTLTKGHPKGPEQPPYRLDNKLGLDQVFQDRNKHDHVEGLALELRQDLLDCSFIEYDGATGAGQRRGAPLSFTKIGRDASVTIVVWAGDHPVWRAV